jgi:hypothetical protein
MRSQSPARDVSAAKRLGARLVAALAFGLLSALVIFAAGMAQTRAQVRPPVLAREPEQERRRPRRVEPASPFEEQERNAPEDEAEGESESGEDEEERRPRVMDPAAVMRAARLIHVRSLSAFINAREVEDSLRKRKEVRAWGLVITRNENEADLVIEITRKAFTRRYTFTVLDPRTMLVVTSGKTRSVIFGKKIADKVAEKFANRMRAVRPYPAPAPNP